MAAHVAVVGSGGWSRVHLRALSAHPSVDRVTLCARNSAAAAERANEFPIVRRVVTDPAVLWADSSIAWVHVVLPHHLHASTTLEALAAGKDVICEKPAATRLADFDRAVASATQLGRRLLVVLNQLYNPVAQSARALVEAGAIGRPFLSVENSYAPAARHYRDPIQWRTDRAGAGGGILIDGGFHMVYRHLYYLQSQGWPAWVLGETPQLNVDPRGESVAAKGEDCVTLTVGYRTALRLQWSHGWTLPAAPERARQSFLAGSDAVLEFTDREADPLVLRDTAGNRAVAVAEGPRTGPDTTHACLLDLIASLASGREPAHENLRLCRASLAVILAGYESSRRGCRVDLAL